MSGQAVNKALVLSPHPDDESVGCGGTIRLLTNAGGVVDVLYITRGELGVPPGTPMTPASCEALARQRSLEAQRACGVLGVSRAIFLSGRDSGVDGQPEIAGQILAALRAGGYTTVFCPWPGDGHEDHKATFRWFRQALGHYQGNLQIWLYEVWQPLQPNMTLGIDATVDAKVAAVREHESQMRVLDYASGFLGLSRYRSLFCPQARHAEAFFHCDQVALLQDADLPWSKAIA